MYSAAWIVVQWLKQREWDKQSLELGRWGDDGAQEAEGLHSVAWGRSGPGHQMVNVPPVGGLIPTRDGPSEGGVVH